MARERLRLGAERVDLRTLRLHACLLPLELLAQAVHARLLLLLRDDPLRQLVVLLRHLGLRSGQRPLRRLDQLAALDEVVLCGVEAALALGAELVELLGFLRKLLAPRERSRLGLGQQPLALGDPLDLLREIRGRRGPLLVGHRQLAHLEDDRLLALRDPGRRCVELRLRALELCVTLVELAEALVEPRLLRPELALVRRERARPILELGHAPRDLLLELRLALRELERTLVELGFTRGALEPVVERRPKLELARERRVELGAELVGVRVPGGRWRRNGRDGLCGRPRSLLLGRLRHRRARRQLGAQAGSEAAFGRLFRGLLRHRHLRTRRPSGG